MKRFTKSFSWKTPIIKVNSIPIARHDDDERDHERTPLAQVPPPSSLPPPASTASSITIVEKDVHNLEPVVHTHGWKPETMQSPVLVALALASLLIAALLEILAQKSAAEGALSIVPTADDIPGLISFAYLYLPTIVAVLYSLAWNWVDLDVKRMQPWLELSRKEGATGRDSLFLDYPVDFVAFVPFKAAKRKHWAVFYSGTIVVFVFWLLTPMQGAVFGTGPVLIHHKTNISHTQNLVEASQQAALLDQAVLNAGYAITWLNQDYPAFATPDYAVRPFAPSASALTDAASNWTGSTTKYWTDLACRPAFIQRRDLPSVTADFLDGRGCNASNVVVHYGIDNVAKYKMMYIGYQDSAWADLSLDSPTCGDQAWNEFLATWASFDNATHHAKISGAFCETTYWKQDVTATVDAATRRPIAGTMVPHGQPETLRDTEFNSSAFQHLLGAGVSSVDQPRDYPFTSLLEQFTRVTEAGLQFPLSPMIGFALGLQNFTTAQYENVTVMGQSFAAAHRMLFSVAFQHLLVNGSSSASGGVGEAHVARYGIIVSRKFSALVEGCLVLVTVMTMLLLWTCRRAPSMLSGELASLDSLLALVRHCGDLQDVFSGTGHMGEEELRFRLGGYRFQLRCGCLERSKVPTMCVAGSPDYEKQADESLRLKDEFKPAGYLAPVKPAVLRIWVGFIFWAVIAAAAGVLLYFKQIDTQMGGLLLPSTSPEMNTVLTSYLPTVFSTLIEPIWVLLNRFYCILQPFYDLISTHRSTEPAMKSRYTALPPQLVFWRALKAKHFLLATVCVTALLGNVLAVGLGALFNELPKRVTVARSFTALHQPTLGNLEDILTKIQFNKPSRYDDPYYVVMANLSYGTALPAWTTSEFAFLPLGGISVPQSTDALQASIFSAETIGFGVEPNCRSLGIHNTSGLPPEVSMTFPNVDPAIAREICPKTYRPQSPLLNNTNYAMPVGSSAAEIIDTVTPSYNGSVCDETFLLGWTRAVLHNRTGEVHTSLVACSPMLRTARFRVSFDRAGHVHAASNVSAFSSAWPYQNTSLAGTQPLVSALHYKLRNRQLAWHNDTVSYDWVNYLLKVYARSGDATDPATSLPQPNDMVGSVSAVYKMVFAALLGLNADMFIKSPPGALTEGTETRQEPRIFMSTSAFVVSIVILGIYMLMALAYYVFAVKLFLPRIPSTLGSQLSYIAPSGLVTEPAEHRYLGKRSARLRFGRFVGHDGKAQIGIDRADKVVPLDMKRLYDGDTRPSKFRFLRLRSSSSRKEAWL